MTYQKEKINLDMYEKFQTQTQIKKQKIKGPSSMKRFFVFVFIVEVMKQEFDGLFLCVRSV